MKKNIYLLSVFFILFSANSQQIQWANKLIKFSSDLGGKQFGVKRVLGRPDVFPQGGYSPNAWVPKKALDGYEWLEVGFEKPQTVKQIAIFENLNAGCVVRIGVDKSGSGKYETVWTRKKDYKTPVFKATIPADRSYYFKRKRRKIQDAPDVVNPGIERVILDNAESGVVAVRVEFNFALLPGQKQIDAIGISDSAEPIEVKINAISDLESLSAATLVDVGGINPSSVKISKGGATLFVTGLGDEKDIVYSLTRNAGKWGSLKEQPMLSSNPRYNYIEYLSDTFILKGGLPYSKGTNESGFELLSATDYSSLGMLKISAYSNYEDTADATITSDAKTLVLGIETDFSQGGIDLYFSQRKEDGSYSFLQNMGKVVNSAGDENMPYLLSDSKTLIFCGNGFSSYGNTDLFVTHRLDDTWKNWSEPINLGSKINTVNFDGNPYYDEENEELYFVSSDGNNVLKIIKLPRKLLDNN